MFRSIHARTRYNHHSKIDDFSPYWCVQFHSLLVGFFSVVVISQSWFFFFGAQFDVVVGFCLNNDVVIVNAQRCCRFSVSKCFNLISACIVWVCVDWLCNKLTSAYYFIVVVAIRICFVFKKKDEKHAIPRRKKTMLIHIFCCVARIANKLNFSHSDVSA